MPGPSGTSGWPMDEARIQLDSAQPIHNDQQDLQGTLDQLLEPVGDWLPDFFPLEAFHEANVADKTPRTVKYVYFCRG